MYTKNCLVYTSLQTIVLIVYYYHYSLSCKYSILSAAIILHDKIVVQLIAHIILWNGKQTLVVTTINMFKISCFQH